MTYKSQKIFKTKEEIRSMTFMDKMKDMAGKAKSTMESAAQAGKEKYEQVKQENAEKKAQKEARWRRKQQNMGSLCVIW